MKIKIGLLVVIVLMIVAGVWGKSWLDDYYGRKLLIAKQNHLADSTAVVRLEKDSVVMFHRYARILSLSDSLLEENAGILKDRDETILSLVEAELRIRLLESEGTTTEVDTTKQELYFRQIDRGFYVYDLFVSFPNRYHKLSLQIRPFITTVIITERVSDGIFSGYLEFDPDYVADYLSVGSMEVYIDEAYFTKVKDSPALRLGIATGVMVGGISAFSAGVGILVGDKHYFDAKYALGDNVIQVNYTWFIW